MEIQLNFQQAQLQPIHASGDLINEEDLFIVDNPSIGNTFKCAIVHTIKAFELKKEKMDGNNLGGTN